MKMANADHAMQAAPGLVFQRAQLAVTGVAEIERSIEDKRRIHLIARAAAGDGA